MAITVATRANPCALTDLPDEVLLTILSLLAIPDLLQCSRTCRILRELAVDPVLHHARRKWASANLQLELARRKTRSSISPPNAWIWLSKTNVLSRSISKSLVRIRLCHSLEQRPSVKDLVRKAIMPSDALHVSPILVQIQRDVRKSQLKDGLSKKLERRPSMSSLVSMNILPEECARRTISPALINARRRVIKENLKDGLRAWVQSRGLKAQKTRAIELDQTERTTVKALVRRLTARRLADELEHRADAISMEKKRALARWGRALETQRLQEERRATGQNESGCAHPTRAHVARLRRFWEGSIRPTSL